MSQNTEKTKKKKIEVKTTEDIKLLPKEEQMKWEVAKELGLFDKIVSQGWKSLTGKESGRIGGIISSRQKHPLSQKSSTKAKS